MGPILRWNATNTVYSLIQNNVVQTGQGLGWNLFTNPKYSPIQNIVLQIGQGLGWNATNPVYTLI